MVLDVLGVLDFFVFDGFKDVVLIELETSVVETVTTTERVEVAATVLGMEMDCGTLEERPTVTDAT